MPTPRVDLGTAMLREVVAKLVILGALGFVPIVGVSPRWSGTCGRSGTGRTAPRTT
jgi:hypothetical protein